MNSNLTQARQGSGVYGLRMAVFCFGLLFLTQGCGWVAVALLSQGGGSSGGGGAQNRASIPQVLTLAVENTQGFSRPVDLTQVGINFQLLDPDATPAVVQVNYSTDGGQSFQPCTIGSVVGSTGFTSTGNLMDLPTSGMGVTYDVTWQANMDLANQGLNQVAVQVIAGNGTDNGIPASIFNLLIGNDVPTASEAAIFLFTGQMAATDEVVLRYRMTDTTRDPTNISLEMSIDNGASFFDVTSFIIAGRTTNLLPDDPATVTGTPPTQFDLVLDSEDALVGMGLDTADIQQVQLRVTPMDIAASGPGVSSTTAAFQLLNNTPTNIVVTEPAFSSDVSGSFRIAYSLSDEESDLVDVVVQYSLVANTFPDLPSNINDQATRRKLLLDPDVRSQFQVVTPRLRTLAEGRLGVIPSSMDLKNLRIGGGVALGDFDARFDILPSHIALVNSSSLARAQVEFLEKSGAVAFRRRVSNSVGTLLTLDEAVPVGAFEANQRVRITQSFESLFFDLKASDAEGAPFEFAWDPGEDLRLTSSAARVFFRFIPFSNFRQGTPIFTSFGRTITTEGLLFTNGQGTTNDPMVPGYVPGDVTVADVNEDSFLDFVFVANFVGMGPPPDMRPPSLVRVKFGEQPRQLVQFFNGAFGDILGGGSFTRVIAGDLNKDGLPDVLALDAGNMAAQMPPVLSLRLTDRGQQTAMQQNSMLAGEGRAILAADFDGDGNQDVAVLTRNAGSNALRIYYGDGSFSDINASSIVRLDLTLSLTGEGVAMDQADLNNDGQADLLVMNNTGAVSLLLSDSPRSYSESSVLNTGGVGANSTFVELRVGDFNSDKRPDLVRLNQSQGLIVVNFGTGGGSFNQNVAFTIQTGPMPTDLEVVDIGCDGLLDLISTDSAAASSTILLGRGDGSFILPTLSNFNAGLADVKRGVAGDFDNDGFMDFANVGETVTEIGVLFNVTKSLITENNGPPNNAGAAASMVVGDFTNSGVLDVLTFDPDFDELLIFNGLGDGSFSQAGQPDFFFLEGGPTRGAAGDFDQDGLLDVAVATVNTETVAVLFNDGFGNFRLPGITYIDLGLSQFPNFIKTGDLDNDGNLDLVITSVGEGFRLNTARGIASSTQFEAVVSIDVPGESGQMELADFNRDGNLDCIVCFPDSQLVNVYQGNGDGSFNATPLSAVSLAPSRPISVRVADFDGDGQLDIIVGCEANAEGPEVLLYRGEADKFALQESLEAELSGAEVDVVDIELADINRDGRLDIVLGYQNLNTPDIVTFFLGLGQFTFERGTPALVAIGGDITSLRAQDFNNDGVVDVAVTDETQSRLSILINRRQTRDEVFLNGSSRVKSPTLGAGDGGDMVLAARLEAYVIDTTAGTIDGVKIDSFRREAFHFRSFTIQSGAKAEVRGSRPLVILATQSIVIEEDATLDCSGQPGSSPPVLGGSFIFAGLGGAGGPGAGRGGHGAGLGSPRSMTSQNNQPATLNGENGFGLGGGFFAQGEAIQGLPMGGSGGGGGFAASGADVGMAPGSGGRAYGNHALLPLFGGSGGAGGGVADADFGRNAGTIDFGDFAGGGAGGGGGAVRLTAQSITIDGSLLANGGNGARGALNFGGHGGGGSGGGIVLQARSTLSVGAQARVEALPGEGIAGGSTGEPPASGKGSVGRIRFEDADGLFGDLSGIVEPPQSEGVLEAPIAEPMK